MGGFLSPLKPMTSNEEAPTNDPVMMRIGLGMMCLESHLMRPIAIKAAPTLPFDMKLGGGKHNEKKTLGVKTYGQLPTKDGSKYKRDEEEAQYKSKRSRVEQETSTSHRPFNDHSPSTHGSGFLPMH